MFQGHPVTCPVRFNEAFLLELCDIVSGTSGGGENVQGQARCSACKGYCQTNQNVRPKSTLHSSSSEPLDAGRWLGGSRRRGPLSSPSTQCVPTPKICIYSLSHFSRKSFIWSSIKHNLAFVQEMRVKLPFILQVINTEIGLKC